MRSLFFWHCVQHASVIDWQQSSCPACLVSPLVRGPSAVALLGTWCQFAAWTVFLLSRWWRPGGQGLFFPLCPVQCLLHREPVRNNAKWMVLSQTQPPLCRPSVLFFPTYFMNRSYYPGHCSCWSELYCTRPLLLQLLIHKPWSKTSTQFQG